MQTFWKERKIFFLLLLLFSLFWWRFTISSKRWKEKEEETEKKEIRSQLTKKVCAHFLFGCRLFVMISWKKRWQQQKKNCKKFSLWMRNNFLYILFQFTWVSQLVWLFKVLIMNFISFTCFGKRRREKKIIYIFLMSFLNTFIQTRSFILSIFHPWIHQARALKDWMIFGIHWYIWLSFSFKKSLFGLAVASFFILILFIQWNQ